MPADAIKQSNLTDVVSDVLAPSPILTKLLHKDGSDKDVKEEEIELKSKEEENINALKFTDKLLVNGNSDDVPTVVNRMVKT